MEKRYINESRYKKGTSRKRRDSTTIKSRLNSSIKMNEVEQVKESKVVKKKQTKKKTRKTVKQHRGINIFICIVLLIIIAVISRAILKDENEPFIPLPFMTSSNDEVINIGIITQNSLIDTDINNIVLNELNKYSQDMLLEVKEDYSITYKCVSSVNKVSNTEYNIIRNSQSKVSASSIKKAIDDFRQNEASSYYSKLSNVDSVTIVDQNKLNIKLKKEDPYFVYNLDICINTSNDLTNYTKNSSESQVIFNRHEDANNELPAKIVVTKYKDMYAAVEAYKDSKINMFVTNAGNVENILGKYEYNIKTYRNGQSVFLFGNPKSEIYAIKEVRQAIAYSIDRDSIIRDILKSKGDKIDLPYIYDNVKYKYDVYAAHNLLLTSGYKKTNNVYSKTEKGVKTVLKLDLIVNKEDNIKVSIADKIKNNLNAVGIKINVEKLTQSQIKSRIQKGNYDLILASVNLNNNPDLTFVNNNLFVTEQITNALTNIENSTVQDLQSNITILKNALSQEISVIGIYSDVSYLIYNKDIIGIQNLSYMNLFKDILS